MFTLSQSEISVFESLGFLGPYTLQEYQEMDKIRTAIEREVFASHGPYHRDRFESRHQDCPSVYEICSDSKIIDRVSSLLGPNVILWNSVFFVKQPGGREVPWHQDRDFLLLDPPINVAAWIAIDDATPANGCLQIIPGSHFENVPHIPRTNSNQFVARADLHFVNRENAVDLMLKSGQFILFHKDLLHHSATNLSLSRRMGLVVRYTVPGVRVNTAGLFRGHYVYCVKGQDDIRLNPVGKPPI